MCARCHARQRYHYEVYGFVVLPELLSAAETAALLGELQQLRARLVDEADAAGVRAVEGDKLLADGPPRSPALLMLTAKRRDGGRETEQGVCSGG